MMVFASCGIVLLSWIGLIQFNNTFGLLFSLVMVILMSLDVLYVTSKILHHYGPEHTMLAAMELLISFVVMLWYMLQLVLYITSSD